MNCLTYCFTDEALREALSEIARPIQILTLREKQVPVMWSQHPDAIGYFVEARNPSLRESKEHRMKIKKSMPKKKSMMKWKKGK